MTSLGEYAVRFGTSGARGLVTDLTDEYCRSFTRAFLTILGPGASTLLVGYDLRPSSPRIAAACLAAAKELGIAATSAGPLPTPALAFASQNNGCAAIMVTGSHIPADRNGLKAYRPTGEITKADEQAMLQLELGEPSSSPCNPDFEIETHHLRRYTVRYIDGFPAGALTGMKVGVYEHSTVARDVMHDVLRALGAETIRLGRSDAFVPVDTEAVRDEDHRLAAGWAGEYGLDAIVSADGDADRPMVADERGHWLRGDVLGILCARVIGAATVVTPVSSSTALEKSGCFGKTIRTRIGSPHVIAAMAGPGLAHPVVGFEANGGFLLGSDIMIEDHRIGALLTRDAMLPILLTLTAARREGKAVSTLAASLPQRFTHSDRIEGYAPGESRALLSRLEQDGNFLEAVLTPRSGDVLTMDRTDGLRAVFSNGDIVHLRPSGNAPELRCYAEADTPERARTLCFECLARLSG